MVRDNGFSVLEVTEDRASVSRQRRFDLKDITPREIELSLRLHGPLLGWSSSAELHRRLAGSDEPAFS